MDTLETTAIARTDETEGRARRAGGPLTGPATALLTLAIAGVLHVVAAVDHRGGSDLVVGFFLLVAGAQLATAAWLSVGAATGRRPAAWPVAIALTGTIVLVALYLVAHTTDLLADLTSPGAGTVGHDHDVRVEGPVPLGQEPASTGELPGLLGSATVAVELVAMMALLGLLPPAFRRRATDGLLVLGACAWVLWWTGVLG